MQSTLWPACVRSYTFEEQLSAAKAGGYDSLAIGYLTYRSLTDKGMSPAHILELAGSYGISLSHFDGFTDWAPERYTADFPEPAKAVFDVSVSECLEICEALGIRGICTTGAFAVGRYCIDQLAECLADFSSRAEKIGVYVDLEFIPMFSIPNLEMAWDIVRKSEAKNASVMFDTWHFFKGRADMELLESMPPDSIRTVQVADALGNVSADALLEDCLHNRKLPGDGDLPLRAVLSILQDKQKGIQSVGPEIFSDVLDEMPAEKASKLCSDKTSNLLSSIGWRR